MTRNPNYDPFTPEEVLDEIGRWQRGELAAKDSPVVQAWLDMAWAMSVPGWKNSFITATPWMFFDSTWWMPAM
jgi:hypothetical protein